MKIRPQQGVLLISIDVVSDQGALTTDRDRLSTGDDRAVTETIRWLLAALDEYKLPATWFFARSAADILRSQVLAAEMRHEVGLFVGQNAPAERTRRDEFSSDVRRRLLAARVGGAEITSVALSADRPVEHVDLLNKHGIRAVRQPMTPRARRHGKQAGWQCVQPLRFGIWNLPATIQFTAGSWWSRWIARPDHRRIKWAASQQQYCHLAINARALADVNARRRLRRTLRLIARLCDRSRHRQPLQVLTIAALTDRLTQRTVIRGAQSILRAA